MMVLQQMLIVDNLLKKRKIWGEKIIGCSVVDERGVQTLE